MYDFAAVDDFYASEYLIEYVECLFEREDFIIEFALNWVKITHIAVLHD